MLESISKPRIGYMCSYVPQDYICELGFSLIHFSDLEQDKMKNANKLPMNLCNYVIHCIDVLDRAGIDGLIITNCCNSMQRLYDYVQLTRPDINCYMLELPRDGSIEECLYFGRRIIELTEKLKKNFSSIQMNSIFARGLISKDNYMSEIFVMGNAISISLRKQIEYHLRNYALHINHCGMRGSGDALWQKYLNYTYCNDYIGNNAVELPCARMHHYFEWFRNYITTNERLKGVVCFSSQNCDNYLFAFPIINKICKENGIPVIQLETCFIERGTGQFATRLEAFIECLEFNDKKPSYKETVVKINTNNPFTQRMKLTRFLLPKMQLKAIKMVVENQIELFTKLIWENQDKIVWTNMVMTPELFYAAGLIPVNIELIAGWLSSLHLSKEYISHSEGNGLSPSICSYHKATIGLIDDGGLCRPKGIAVSSNICDGSVGVAHYFKEKFGTSTFVLNVPFHKNDISSGYLIGQYKKLVTWIEEYTGKELRNDEIKEALILSNKTREYWLNVLEMRKMEPVVPGRYMLRNLFGATFLFGSHFGYEVVKQYHDEMSERYQKRDGKVSSMEYKRILWIHFAPLYHNGLLEYLEDELNCRIVFDITGHIYWSAYDIEKGLESLALRMASHFYLEEAEGRKQLYEEIIINYRVDGVIHMMHNGCRAIPGASWQVRDVADALNVPYLELSGDCIDPRGFSEEQMKLRLEAFKETLWRRKIVFRD